MSKDFEYFTEFLADPSKYPFDEFHKWAKEWGRYIIDHEGEFNYLEDDEWKEIRERLLDVFYAREHEMDEAEDEWEEICEIDETVDTMQGKEFINFMFRKLNFLKDHKYYFNFDQNIIRDFEKHIMDYVRTKKDAELAQLRASLKKIDYDNSIAELDDELVRYYERTGKIPRVTTHQPKKKHNGN